MPQMIVIAIVFLNLIASQSVAADATVDEEDKNELDQIKIGPHGKHQLSNKKENQKNHQNQFTHSKVLRSRILCNYLAFLDIHETSSLSILEQRTSLTEEKHQKLMAKFKLHDDQTVFFMKTQLSDNTSGKTKLNDVITLLGKSLQFINQYDNMVEFLACKRCNKEVLPIISEKYPETKQHFLTILKSLIEIAPDDVKSNLTLDICDKVVDIFVKDKNSTTKSVALNVLNKWMPCNPPVQLRVLGNKELETLYSQLEKLDSKGVYTFFSLLNKLLNEHRSGRDKNRQHSEEDIEKGRIYTKIALIERLSSPRTCNTLIEFLDKIFKVDKEKDNIMVPIFELIKHISQPCMGYFKRNRGSREYFKAVHDYAVRPEIQEYYQNLDVNVTETISVLKDYLEEFKLTKKTEL